MNDYTWEKVKQFYKTRFNIEPELVDVMSCMEILVMCVSGYSNSKISETLHVDIQEVNAAIKKYLGIDGWSSNLTISPIKLYKDGETVLGKELDEICRIYSLLEELLDEKWV